MQIIAYCIAVAAVRNNITLFGWTAMSNHMHLLVRDNEAKLPEFLAYMNRLIARGINALRKRRENMWASEQANAVFCIDSSDQFDKLVYLLANPVAAHLVERASEWPGASSLKQHLTGDAEVIDRPDFLSADGPMPDKVTLRAQRLPGFDDLSQKQWKEKILKAMRTEESRARAIRRKTKGQVVGVAAVLAVDPTDTPATLAKRGGLRPQIAGKSVEHRIEQLLALKVFRAAYRAARLRWFAGEREVLFPHGTYRMLKFGVRCGPCEPPMPPIPTTLTAAA